MKNLALIFAFILLIILSAAAENRVYAQTTYTWNGIISTDYQTATNWTPARTVPANTDILVFNGISTPAPTVTNIPNSQTIGQLQFINNVNATFGNSAAATSTLTVGGGSIAGDDFVIAAGSALTINAATNTVRIAGSSSSTGNIAGTLTLAGSTNNGLTLSNNFIVTISGTVNDAGTLSGATTARLIFTGTAVYNKTNTTVVGEFPNGATWQDGSRTNIIGYTTANGRLTNFGSGNNSFSNLTWNCPSQTGTISLGNPSANFSVRDVFTITSTGTGSISLTDSVVANQSNSQIIVVNYSQTSGTLNLNASSNAASSTTFFQSGTFNQTGGSITVTSTTVTANLIEFRGTVNQAINLSGTNPGFINYRVLNAAGITLNGTIALNSVASGLGPSLRISSTASPAISGTGIVTYGANTILIYDAGTFDSVGGNQTASANEFPAVGSPPNLTINNTTGAPNNTVAIPFDRTITGTISLTEGFILTGMNTLTSSTAGNVFRTNGFVEGNFSKLFPVTANGSFEFPVGTVSGTDDGYTPVNLTNLNVTTAGGGLTVAAVDAFLPGLNTTNSADRYWTLTEVGAISANLTFTYLDPADVNGIEEVYKIYKKVGMADPLFVPGSNNTAGNSLTTTSPQTDFSDWGIGDSPTAASVNVGGRVLQANGRGVFRARVTILDSQGISRTAYTNPFGYYQFDEVPAGENYIFTVWHLRYQFAQPTQVEFIGEEGEQINFTALPIGNLAKPKMPDVKMEAREIKSKQP